MGAESGIVGNNAKEQTSKRVFKKTKRSCFCKVASRISDQNLLQFQEAEKRISDVSFALVVPVLE